MTTLEQVASEVLDGDVLVVGGGIVGCFAAMRARESGLDAVLVDKSNSTG